MVLKNPSKINLLKDIKITMLGNTGAGKTSYLLGMYAVMQTGVQGFTLSAKDMDVDLDLTSMWEKLIDVQAEDRWPPPNAAEMKTYAFDFSYGFKQIIGFEWLDYRGLALTDRSTEKDVQELSEYLGDSSCAFLCVSGEYLGSQVTPFTVRDTKSDRMNQFMQQVISTIKKPTSTHPFPIAITITKYDLCNHREKQEVIEDIKKLFPALFTPNSGWSVMICPVSLGKELSQNIEQGNIVPINIHLPVIFAIYSQLKEYVVELKEMHQHTYVEIEKLKQSRVRKFFKFADFNDKLKQFQDIEKKIETVEENINLLAEELQQVSLFVSGQEVSASV